MKIRNNVADFFASAMMSLVDLPFLLFGFDKEKIY